MLLFDSLGPAVSAGHSDKRDSVSRVLCVGEDAADELARELRSEVSGRALVLFDRRTREVAGHPVTGALRSAGFSVSEAMVPDGPGGSPACDDVTLGALGDRVTAPDVCVGVGAGVISDLSKWLAFEFGIPAAVFATAASMNGYAAANVAPAIEGVKSLVHARAHRVIAAHPQVLVDAPYALSSAGLGDVLARTVSTADWRMNHLLFGEPYSEAIASILDDVESGYLDVPDRLAAREPAAISSLFDALVFSGCAMTLHGSSLPASGGEHLISHALDMRAHADGGVHDLHGRQVGVATIFVSALYARVLELDTPAFRHDSLPFDREGWGATAPAVARQHAAQGKRMVLAAERLARPGSWDRFRSSLSGIVPPAERTRDILRRAGGAFRVSDLGLTTERFIWAVLNGAQMRERFTSLDLAWTTGILPGAAFDIVDEWLN